MGLGTGSRRALPSRQEVQGRYRDDGKRGVTVTMGRGIVEGRYRGDRRGIVVVAMETGHGPNIDISNFRNKNVTSMFVLSLLDKKNLLSSKEDVILKS